MGKIVGNFITFFLCIIVNLSVNLSIIRADVILQGVDMQGEQLEQAVAGQPFTVEVIITDLGKGFVEPEIKEISGINIRRVGLYMSTINGKSTIKYSYQVHIDASGTYRIGPALVSYHGKQIESNQLDIVVVKQQKSVQSIGDKQKKVFLELLVDKDHVVIGQKIICTLTFYFSSNTIALKQVGQPELKDFRKKSEQKPYVEKIKKDGVLYNYIRWKWEVYPQKQGNLIIPAHRADYEVENKKRKHSFGGFGFFFGNRVEHKRVYSNAVQIQVDPLPKHSNSVDAVGDFKHMRATIKPAEAKQGEAMVLTIEIKGDGDLESIETLQLKKMPKSLKYYDSKQYVVKAKNKNQLSKKRFEYVIQGLEPGDWKIPKQRFTYFDINSHTYKTLKTESLIVKVIANPLVQTKILPDENKKAVKQEKDIENDKLFPLLKGPWYPSSKRQPIPQWLFIFLMSIPILFNVFSLIRARIRRHYKRYEPRFRSKRAFANALLQLKNAKSSGDCAKVYHIIIQLFADRFQTALSYVSHDSIKELLHVKGVSADRILRWNKFFDFIAAHAFGKGKKNNELFLQAKQWIEYFKQIL